jgi:biotin carboxyl carrier protein
MKWVVSGRLEAAQSVECTVTPTAEGAALTGGRPGSHFLVQVGLEQVAVEVLNATEPVVVLVNGKAFEVVRHGPQSFSCNGVVRSVVRPNVGAAARPRSGGSGLLVAPMPGRVLRVCCAPGDRVTRGQSLVVLEAMKMESEQLATIAGTVREVLVREGASVDAGAALIRLDPVAPVDDPEPPR